jgi:demethylmenaquinone methyltransferase/2-methoxy-6-polyprenyl-1,4-benzoquinol methylase
MDKLADYYAKRAAEYERIYAKPERQRDLAALKERIRKMLSGRRVLELACGTGYWTEVFAPVAREVTALDVNQEVLDIARAKSYPPQRVEFMRADCTAPPDLGRRHDALFAGFWWSHVPLQRLDGFLAASAAAVAPRALIAFLDNRYVEGSSTPVARRDADGNAYQLRTLDDGSSHEVLKNFPSEGELIKRTVKTGWGANVEHFEHYWLLSYRANA